MAYIKLQVDAELLDSYLQHLEVVNALVLLFCLPVDFVHGNNPWLQDVQQLAIDRPRPQLLHAGNL